MKVHSLELWTAKGKHKQKPQCRITHHQLSLVPKVLPKTNLHLLINVTDSTERVFILLHLNRCPKNELILMDSSRPAPSWKGRMAVRQVPSKDRAYFLFSLPLKNTQTRLIYGWLISDV